MRANVEEVQALSDSLQGRPRHKLIVGKTQTAMTTKATTSIDEDEGSESRTHLKVHMTLP